MVGIVGVDVGTAGCRACVYNIEGELLSSASLEYPLYMPQASWAEQSPEKIYDSVILVIRNVVEESYKKGDSIAVITFSTVFHSLILVDEKCNAIYPMLTWADLRSHKYSEYIKKHYDANDIYSRTGCPVHPMYPLSKILWFKNERPSIFSKTFKFISIKEYIICKFFNKFIVDRSIASGTGIYNIYNRCWDKELIELLDIDHSQLSEVVPTTHIEVPINKKIAEELNIAVNTPICLGAGDGVLSAVGTGAVNPGQAVATIGTSGAVRVVIESPKLDMNGRTWCYNLTDKYWVAGGAINNGGIVLRWVRDNFAPCEQVISKKIDIDPYDILTACTKNVPPASNGLIMLPFFLGERSPYWNANARGVLFGLNLKHKKEHVVKATLEGIIYRMYSIYLALKDVTGNIEEIRVSGSFIRSKLWLQIMADVFGKIISLPSTLEGAAYGSAILGYFSIGKIRELKEGVNNIKIIKNYYPNLENHKKYEKIYHIYERIYWNLQKEFEEIVEIQKTFDQ
jgi:gluconokinase